MEVNTNPLQRKMPSPKAVESTYAITPGWVHYTIQHLETKAFDEIKSIYQHTPRRGKQVTFTAENDLTVENTFFTFSSALTSLFVSIPEDMNHFLNWRCVFDIFDVSILWMYSVDFISTSRSSLERPLHDSSNLSLIANKDSDQLTEIAKKVHLYHKHMTIHIGETESRSVAWVAFG